jgi:hypothetical protein
VLKPLLPILFAWVLPCLADSRACTEPEHSLPADIDAAATPPCTEVWAAQSTPSTVVSRPLGSYRVLGGSYLDRMAYLFRADHVDDFLRLTITYPDDAPRNAEVFTFSEADQSYGLVPLGTGYFTGDPYPITHRLIQQTFYFYTPGSQKFAVVLMTSAPGRPAALTRIRVEKVNPADPPPASSPASSDDSRNPGRRKIGMYWEDQVFQQNFSELSVPRMTFDQRSAAFQRALDRHVLYMRRTGLNLVIDPVVWYASALFQPSAEYSAQAAAKWGLFRPPDFDRWMADRYSKEGFDYWPSIRSWSLPSLAEWVKTSADVSSGAATEYVNAVDKNGKVLTSSAWHNPPMLNAFHPRVKAALDNLVGDIMDRIGSYDSVRGIALWTTIHSSHGLGTIDQSYDDYTLSLFAKELGLRLPKLHGPPEDRFKTWYQWLRAEHWNEWIGWRKHKQTELYSALAGIVAHKKPGARLNLMIFYPAPTMTVGLTVDDAGAYLDGIGLDLDALARNPNILITRLILAHEYQHKLCTKPADAPGMPELLARSRLDFSPEWQQPFLGKTAGAVVQYTYFEHNLASEERMHPVGWRAPEPGWHVTSPKAAGQNALEYLARSIALLDPLFIAYGGFQMGPQGMEDTAVPLVRAFTSLPAVRFATLRTEEGVVVRRAVAEGFQWTYAVNATAQERKVDLGAGPVTIGPWQLLVSKTRGR